MDILWVEDRMDEVSVLVDALLGRGHSIILAGTRERAEKILDEGWRGDLIVLDSFVSEMGGRPEHVGCDVFISLREGRWGDWGRGVDVLFVTGYEPIVRDRIGRVSPPPKEILGKPIGVREALEGFSRVVPGLNVVAIDGSRVTLTVGRSGDVKQGDEVRVDIGISELAALKEVAKEWLALDGDEACRAAHLLLSIVGARNAPAKAEAIESFQSHARSLGERFREKLSTAASGVTVALPFLRAMGFSV